MSLISSAVFGGTQRNPTVTISGSGFGTAPAAPATPAGSGMTGSNYGTSLFLVDRTQNLSAGLSNGATDNSVGLVNLSYSDTSISFQLGSAYSRFLYNIKPGDDVGVSVAGSQYFTPATFSPPITTQTVGVARFFDTRNGTHFFTADPNEVQQVLRTRPDLAQEQSALTAIDPTTAANAAPVFRFFDSVYGTHFFTSSTTERDAVIAGRPDLINEGIGFYENTSAQAGGVPVYRYFDTKFGTHFYTGDQAENNTILATRPDLKPEGIAFYAPT